MKIVLVWVLIMVSDGSYNRGSVTVVDDIATRDSCLFLLKSLPPGAYTPKCVQVSKIKG